MSLQPSQISPARPRRVVPWLTLALSILAIAAACIPHLSAALILERKAADDGQLWRLWSGHFTHFTLSHLIWNLAVFIPAGCWLERLTPWTARLFYSLSPVIISLSIMWGSEDIQRYAGLSGLATGVLALLALTQLRAHDESEPSWFWWSILGVIAVKIAGESFFSASMVADLGPGVRNVPMAHVIGTLCAFLFASFHPKIRA